MKNNRSLVNTHPSSVIPHPFPKRRFGQNFLVDRKIVAQIIAEVNPQSHETIIEIGPGRGALTSNLAAKAGRVLAIELDRELVPQLREKFSNDANLQVIEADALAANFCEIIAPAETARVVANLPFNIGTAILQRLIGQRQCLTDMTLMLQREVVDRITAAPGCSDRGYLSVFVEAYCETEKLFDVSPQSFRPAPKVWSTVARLRVRETIAADVKDENLLWQIVSAGFAHPRKTILNNLREAPEPIQKLLKLRGGASIVLCEAGIPPLRRAETFALEEWALLVNAI
ncbi:MAG TPA: 16S rRNA (adenine(1518)-N(6)/adenine(1519)-N(6))-dimethyltransferase RsmA [Pyrinomonadaceae bacterium]|nr:16S rRNA (adenine(1518)-N(6)/adenine(1519)-N(6))-dimethyltransferase RsmA [Pyrinomonadaceae bacterium]